MERKGPVIVSDLTKCKPMSAISREIKKETWRAVDYETDEIAGTMLLALEESKVPEIRYDPELGGWYSISVGIWRGTGSLNAVKIKLSSDKTCVKLSYDCIPDSPLNSGDIVETLWKYEDMTGKSVVISHPEEGTPLSSCITHLRFIPLSNIQVDNIKKERSRKDTKRIIATHDIHGNFYHKKPQTIEAFIEEVEPYRYTDVQKLMLEYVIDPMGEQYPTICSGYEGVAVYPREGDRFIAESIKAMQARELDFYSAMIDHAHEMGIKVSLSYRMNAFTAEPPWDSVFTTKYYLDNPQLRCKDKDGSEISRISYAYPQVQDLIISMFKRMLSFGADGIHMLFNRGTPNILYEQPVVDAFIRDKGSDPRELDEEDQTWIGYRTEYFSGFMRKVRRELDEYAHKSGRREKPDISAHVLGDKRSNYFFALDIETWIKEGLVDDIVVYPRLMEGTGALNWPEEGTDIDYFAGITKNTDTNLYIEILPRLLEPKEFQKRAVEIYEKGAFGISLWDSYHRVLFPRRWSMAKRLGHKEELKSWDDGEGQYFRYFTMKKLGGHKVSRYSPNWGL